MTRGQELAPARSLLPMTSKEPLILKEESVQVFHTRHRSFPRTLCPQMHSVIASYASVCGLPKTEFLVLVVFKQHETSCFDSLHKRRLPRSRACLMNASK
jgi:hypothetical protein